MPTGEDSGLIAPIAPIARLDLIAESLTAAGPGGGRGRRPGGAGGGPTRRRGGRPAPGPPIAEARGPKATPAGGREAPRGAPVRDRREKNRAAAIPRGECRRGKEWEAGSTLGLAEGGLTCLLNRITPRFDARVVTPWAEVHLRPPRRVLVRIPG